MAPGRDGFSRAMRQLWRERRGVLPAIALLCFAQHAVLVGEAYVMLGALGAGTTLQTALVFEAVTKIVNTAGLWCPAGWAWQKAGARSWPARSDSRRVTD